MNRCAALAAALALAGLAACGRAEGEEPGVSGRGGATGASGRGDATGAGEPHGQAVQRELDIPYAEGGHPLQRLDLYLPRARGAGKLPVIVYFHGGGWLLGDKSEGAVGLLPFVRSGAYAGVSVGYRLSGEALWPAQIHDAKAAIRWVRAHADRYGLDADRIGVWGRSAGGHLALMVALAGDVPELEGDVGPHAGVSSRVSCVANSFGVSELMALIGQPTDIDRTRPDAPEALLIGGALPAHAELARRASPVTYVTPDDPPVLSVHGTADRTVPFDQAVRLDAALREAGVASHLVVVRGGGHGDFGAAADDRVKALFESCLRGLPVAISTAPITDWRR